MKKINSLIASSALSAFVLLLPCSLLAGPTIIRIDGSDEGSPTTTVLRSEDYNINVGPVANNPATDYGAVVDLLGVDQWPCCSQIADRGWRFTDPNAPDPTHSAVYIVWIDHDYGDPYYYGPLFTGDLRVGFNKRKPGTGYYGTPGPNPPPGADVNAGPVPSRWVTLYSDSNLILQFKGAEPRRGR